jgi:hypothetical protein
LLKVKGVEFDLPITKDSQKLFYSLVGKAQYSRYAILRKQGGVYVFTLKVSGSL